MSSKHLRGDMNFAWPAAEVAVMGPEQAVGIINRREIAEAERRRSATSWEDFSARFGNPYIARMGGQTVGFVGNQPMHLAGVLDIEASRKAARFVRTCDCFNRCCARSRVWEHPHHHAGRGVIPGTCRARRRSTARSSRTGRSCCSPTARRRCRRSRSCCGRLVRRAYLVMSSKHLRGDMNFAWPAAEVAVMGVPEQAVGDHQPARDRPHPRRTTRPTRSRRSRVRSWGATTLR